MDVTKSRGMRDTGTLGRYLCTRIDRTGRLIDVGLLLGEFKVERRIKGVIQVSGPCNLLDSGATDSKQGTKEKELAQRGTWAFRTCHCSNSNNICCVFSCNFCS